jgi:branched-chain amino acid transport system substrate-binding protein
MRLSRRRFLVLGFVAVVSAACAPGAAQPTAPPPAIAPAVAPTSTAASPKLPTVAPATAPTAVPPLKIGLLIPYTEQAIGADIGSSQKRAADLYIKKHGGKLGGREVTLIYSDESIDPLIDVVKVQLFTEKDRVDLIMGGGGATTAYAMHDAAEAAKIVYIDTNATANALTRTVPDCKPSCRSKYVFRTSASAWQLTQPLGEWVSTNGLKEFFLVYADDPFGTESAAAFVEGLEKHGGMQTGQAATPTGTVDWTRVIASIKVQPTRNIFAAFHTDDAEGFIKTWDQLGMNAAGYKLYGPGLLTDVEVLNVTGASAIGIVTSLFWSSDLDNAENKLLTDLFQAEFRNDETGEPLTPDAYAVQMWDAMTALDEALTRTRGNAKDADALIAALETVSFKSPRGAFAFDRATHNPVQDIYIREVKLSHGKSSNTVIARLARIADPF